jgi:hypothetical protein
MTDRTTIINKARAIVGDKLYCDRWFGAEAFFKETYVTGIIKRSRRYFFITRDEMFTGNGIYAVREIMPGRIDTFAGPLDSEEEARAALKEVPKNG